MPRLEAEPGLQQRLGDGLFKGGALVGIVGLLVAGELALAGAFIAAGGYMLKKSGEKG